MAESCDDMFAIPVWAVIIISIIFGLLSGCIFGWCFRRDYTNYWTQRAYAARINRIVRMSPTTHSVTEV